MGIPKNQYTKKTHCPKGHVYNDINTKIDKLGKRSCRKCRRERERLRRRNAKKTI